MNSFVVSPVRLLSCLPILLSLALLSGCGPKAAETVPAPKTPPADSKKQGDEKTGQSVPPANSANGSRLVSAKGPQEGETETTEEEVAEDAQTAVDRLAVREETTSEEAPEPESVLGIGDPAPEIAISTWVKGDPIEGFQDGQVYVVEFWATWCQPCRMSMPHISELQTEYGDKVRFVGVSNEKETVVRDFLKTDQAKEKTWDEVISYTLAMDENDQTNERYMLAAKQEGIPTAFIIGKDGHLDWIGHPMEIEKPLKEVVDGTWNRAAAIQEMVEREEARKRAQVLQVKMGEAVQNQDWDSALSILDELTKDQPADAPGIVLTRAAFLRKAGRDDDARTAVQDITKKHWDDSNTLNAIAWNLAAEMGGVELDLALEMALRADELEEGKSASIHDTVARVYYEKEDLDSAIQWQEKAVAAATGSDSNLVETLKRYQEQKLQLQEPKSEESASNEEAATAEAPSDTTDGAESSDGK